MSAQDYQICTTLASAYIAKISKKNPMEMTQNRRQITQNEILSLIDWYLHKNVDSCENCLTFKSKFREGMRIRMYFYKEKEQ